MIIVYVLIAAYILAINFYSFLLVKSLRDEERRADLNHQSKPLSDYSQDSVQNGSGKNLGRLCIAGALGGAITIYVCMFLFKYQRSNLVLMVLMPLLGVLNVYLFVLLFRAGIGFFVIR